MLPFAFAFVVFSSSFLIDLTHARKCRAIAFEGGGDKGAFEAGVVSGLVQNLPPEDVAWDVVTGISAGAMTAMAMSLFKVGDEVNMEKYLCNMYLNMTRDHVYRPWPGHGLLYGLTNKTGIYDSSPLHSYLKDRFYERGGAKDRKIVVGATNLETGEIEFWDETEPELATATYCSCSIPGVFNTVQFQNKTYVDGSATMPINIYDAVERCFEITNKPEDIIVDIVQVLGNKIPKFDLKANYNAIDVFKRRLAFDIHKKIMSQVANIQATFSEINWRYTIFPTQPLPDPTPLTFNAEQMAEMVKIGQKDAVKAIHAKKNVK